MPREPTGVSWGGQHREYAQIGRTVDKKQSTEDPNTAQKKKAEQQQQKAVVAQGEHRSRATNEALALPTAPANRLLAWRATRNRAATNWHTANRQYRQVSWSCKQAAVLTFVAQRFRVLRVDLHHH